MLVSRIRPIRFYSFSSRWQSALSPSKRFVAALGTQHLQDDPIVDALVFQKVVEVGRRGKFAAPPSRGRPISRRPNEAGEWRCCRCGNYKEPRAFNTWGLHPVLLQSNCKDCESLRKYEYRCTLNGCIRGLLGSAKQRASQRGCSYTLTPDDLFAMFSEQQGLCYYSGVPFNYLQPNSHWRMSLERICNGGGYTRDNCVLIAAEFNTSDYSIGKHLASPIRGTAQWSKHKVQQVNVLRHKTIDLDILKVMIQDARGDDRRGGARFSHYRHRVPNLVGEWQCSVCLSYKPSDEFYYRTRSSNISGKCKSCHREHVALWRRSLRGNMLNMICGASRSALLRGQSCTLTLDVLLDQLWAQRGRCYYSGVPLECRKPHTDWRMSLERLNNDQGYLPENSVWVANEFNTPDQSRNKARYEVHGTAQWSRAKVEHVWGP